jgi:murein L,D-transpeptidase YcbB/YkuD
MKLIISESEKNRILGMHHKVRKMLFEELAEDVANWGEAETWVKSQSNAETGKWPTSDPEYKYAKYKNYQGNWMEIQNNGNAQEVKPSDWSQVHSGTWSWNGSKVIFSWMQSTSSNWEEAKAWLLNLPTAEPDKYTNDSQASEGTWNDYEWARVQLKDNPDSIYSESGDRLEIMSDGKAQHHYYSEDSSDLLRYGKWSWDGSKVIFKWSTTKNSSGYVSDSDTSSTVLTQGNKIINIGSSGPVVKWAQHKLAYYYLTDEGLGTGCKDDQESCDGKFGPKTKELVKKYQRENGLKVDGIIGAETARFMGDYTNPEDEHSPDM